MYDWYRNNNRIPPTPKNPKIEPTQDAQDAVGPKIEPITPVRRLNPPRPIVDDFKLFFNSRLITKKFIVSEVAVRVERIISKNQSLRVKIEIWKEKVLPGTFLTGI